MTTRDPTIGLVYLNNRYHDPTLGRFFSVDPLVASTGDPYIYGSANPACSPQPVLRKRRINDWVAAISTTEGFTGEVHRTDQSERWEGPHHYPVA